MTNPNAMRTAQEILIQYAGDCITVNDLSSYQFTQAMKAYAKEALELAAEKVKMQEAFGEEDMSHWIDRDSILNLKDQLK